MEKNIKWFLKLIIFIGFIFCFIFEGIMPQYSEGYDAAMRDKCRTLKEAEGVKIVVVGDSNVAFGIVSEMLEKEFHMPVVNMGLHGSIGATFHLDMIKDEIHEGDIIICSLADLKQEPGISDGVLAWLTAENDMEILKRISCKDYITMAKAFPTYLKRAIQLWKLGVGNEKAFAGVDTVYQRNSFNKNGDISYPRRENIIEEENPKGFDSKHINIELADYLNEFNRYVQSQGAFFLISSPPIGREYMMMKENEINLLEKELDEKLECPVISDFSDNIYPKELFYNTTFHLTEEGAKIRTQQLIVELKRWMKSGT